jgi:Photoprotection regulator fluorescence recovery protein
MNRVRSPPLRDR